MRKRWAQWCKAEHLVTDPRTIPFDNEESIATQNLPRQVTQMNRPDSFSALKDYFSDFDHGAAKKAADISYERREHESRRGRILADMNRRRDKLHARAAAVGSWLEPGSILEAEGAGSRKSIEYVAPNYAQCIENRTARDQYATRLWKSGKNNTSLWESAGHRLCDIHDDSDDEKVSLTGVNVDAKTDKILKSFGPKMEG